jgi:hypothetical protein
MSSSETWGSLRSVRCHNCSDASRQHKHLFRANPASVFQELFLQPFISNVRVKVVLYARKMAGLALITTIIIRSLQNLFTDLTRQGATGPTLEERHKGLQSLQAQGLRAHSITCRYIQTFIHLSFCTLSIRVLEEH